MKEMKDMECVKKLGKDAVRKAFYSQTRTHEDFPCFCDSPCKYLNENEECEYEWPMKIGDF